MPQDFVETVEAAGLSRDHSWNWQQQVALRWSDCELVYGDNSHGEGTGSNKIYKTSKFKSRIIKAFF